MVKGQSKWEFGFDIQLKKNLLLNANENTLTPERYSYGTGYLNPQFEILAAYRLNTKWQMVTGLGVGYESHYCEFKHGSSNSSLSETFTTRGQVSKVPLRVVYSFNRAFGLIVGGGVNFVNIYATRVNYSFRFGGGPSAYESEFQSGFSRYLSGSLSVGFQYNGKNRTSWFLLGDLELSRYPEVSVAHKYQDRFGNETFYATTYQAHLYSIAVGMYCRIYPKGSTIKQ